MTGPLVGDDDTYRTVRVDDDLGEILATDGEEYEIAAGDTVTLPETTAQPLVERGAAEVVDDAAGDESDDTDADDGGGSALLAAMGDSDEQDAVGWETGDDDTTPSGTGDGGESLSASPTAAVPTSQLEALSADERRRFARKRGADVPTTAEVRDDLETTIHGVLNHEDYRVVESPTGSGKTYTVAATRWGARDELTGGQQVVQLLPTTDARNDAAEIAREHGGEHMVLRSRTELCPVARGDHDPREGRDDDNDRQVLTIDQEPASKWLARQCDEKQVPFSAAHRHLAANNDQNSDLPCSNSGSCPAHQQWERLREEEPPLVLGTHEFAHVPGLRHSKNLVFDERPDFTTELSTERVRRAVSAYLSAVDAPVTTWETFVSLSRYDGHGDDAAAERDALEARLDHEPEREWYIRNPDAHTLAPALARAIFYAEDRANGRRFGQTTHEPPRLDAEVGGDGWNRERVRVVLDDDNNVHRVWATPVLSTARSVVGLDAHPSLERWRLNTTPTIGRRRVLEPAQRQLWRQHERGLRVVQLGDATRPLTSGEYYDGAGVETVVNHLREVYGSDFRTAITAKSVRDRLEGALLSAGVPEPELMHYGETMSRNDFDGESVGLVNGCIDPGDEFVLDVLAAVDADAEPERADAPCAACGDPYAEEAGEGCPECDGTGWQRAHGRTFAGADADRARRVLESVRQSEVAQAVGRWARSPDDRDDTATVYARTDVLPEHMVDVTAPGVVWTYGRKQRDVVESLREADEPLSARRLASRAGCSKEHVRETLQRLAPASADDRPDGVAPSEHVHAVDGAGPNGATLYSDDGTPTAGVAEVGLTTETANSPVWDHYTWLLAIAAPDDDLHHTGDDLGGETAVTEARDGRVVGRQPPD